ncbi:MAG: SulP family inorganic anion transporter [Balneolaceae bacterium]
MKKEPPGILSFLPLAGTLASYKKTYLKGDVNAGLTVGIMLIPQGMAYAVLAGLPPVYGLYASIIPLLLYAVFGTSKHLAVGPVAMVSLLVVAGVGDLAEPGSARFIQLAILTALGVGVVQFLMGIFRMGFLVNFLSHPVLSGFTSAAAIIIGASQLGNLTGIDLPRSNQVVQLLLETATRLQELEPVTALIGFGSIAIILLLKQWKRTFPSALAVVAVGTILTAWLGLNQQGVSIVGEVPTGLPSFDSGFLQWSDLPALSTIILVIALISYMESIAVAKAIASRHGYKIDANQELIALGSANIGGAFFQSFPTTGGFSRTAVNDQSGANTTVASIVSAVVIAGTVLFLTPLFYYLPGAVLAAIIMVAVSSLFDWKEMKRLWKTDRRDFSMLAITFLATLLLGIEEGIAIGVLASLVMVIYSSTRPHSAELGQLGESKNFRNIERFTDALVDEDILIYRYDSSLYFANVEHFEETLTDRIRQHGDSLKLVILDASVMNSLDSTAVHTLEKIIDRLEASGTTLYVAGAIGPVRDTLQRAGLADRIGKNQFFFDVYDAKKAYKSVEEKNRSYSPYPIKQ